MWIQQFVETTRGTFEIFVKGEGEPLAVTHLYSEYDERGTIAANPYTAYYKVYLINLRGAGNSVKASNIHQYSMEESVLDLESIRETLKLQRWGFAGHSTGGMLALKYGINFPSSLTKLIVGGAAASYEYAQDSKCIYCTENANYKRIIEIMDRLNSKETTIEERKSLSYEWLLMSFYKEEKLKQLLTQPNSGKTIGERLQYFRKYEYPTYDVRDALKLVNIPSYIYVGKNDSQCPLKFSEEIASLIPQANLTIFEESNHYPFFEEAEEFEEFVISTLSEIKTTSS